MNNDMIQKPLTTLTDSVIDHCHVMPAVIVYATTTSQLLLPTYLSVIMHTVHAWHVLVVRWMNENRKEKTPPLLILAVVVERRLSQGRGQPIIGTFGIPLYQLPPKEQNLSPQEDSVRIYHLLY